MLAFNSTIMYVDNNSLRFSKDKIQGKATGDKEIVHSAHELTYEEAKKYLKCSTDIYDINFLIRQGIVRAFVHEGSEGASSHGKSTVDSHSPCGSWISLLFPFSQSEQLRDMYRTTSMDEIRIGKLLEALDSLADDVAYRFTSQSDPDGNAYHVTVAVDGINFKN